MGTESRRQVEPEDGVSDLSLTRVVLEVLKVRVGARGAVLMGLEVRC